MLTRNTLSGCRSKIRHRLLFLALIALPVVAGTAEHPDTRPLNSDQFFDPADYDAAWLTLDRDEDGVIDYAVRVDEMGKKLQEALDFNYDGWMDDFYFYSNDVLQREEIDSNFDRQIDIWVFLYRGVWIQMWERDTDFDGVIDARRDYDEKTE